MKRVFIYIFLLALFVKCKKETLPPPDGGIPPVTDSPLLVWTNPSQPNPSKNPPAIFYAPHQDDETLGMGASIANHVRMKKPVYVVLLTNGAYSKAIDILNGSSSCEFHHTTHHYNLSITEFIAARNAEFIAACKALGVHRVYIANAGKGYDESIGLNNMTEKFEKVILYFHKLFPASYQKIINGGCDFTPSGKRSDAHRACTLAMYELRNMNAVKDVCLYKVYVYFFAQQERHADWINTVDEADVISRQRACDEYKYFNPALGRYSIGYAHSVCQLFMNSYLSRQEYIDYLKKDCE